MNEFNKFLTDAAKVEDNIVESEFNKEVYRDRFIVHAAEITGTVSRSFPLFRVLAVAGVLGIIVLSVYIFQNDASVKTLETPQWISVRGGEDVERTFADGSKVVLLSGTKARISSQGPENKIVTIENGMASIHVVHHTNTNWSVMAGPYNVKVTGTRFSVSWNAETEYFELKLFEGQVIVNGPLIENGQILNGGRVLTASISNQNVAIGSLAGEDSDSNSELEADEAVKNDKKTESKEFRAIRKTGKRPAAKELLESANKMRLSGNIDEAKKMYLNLRQNFSNSPQSNTAALYMGRMLFDQERKYKEAAVWLQIYLDNQTDNTLKRETLGRLMEAQYRSGMKQKASMSAKKYIELYPEGPQAALAARLASE
ncbi:MAG: FecR domain-containing protein [Deltaproteobacteria bacterium]|nr:FecR domain-containing protein [Deltaproteobacteria bacterium]